MGIRRSIRINLFIKSFFSVLAFLLFLKTYGVGQPLTHFEQGIMALNRGEYSTAIEEFLLVLKNNPDDKKAQFNLAIAYEKKGDYYKSYYAWKRYLELDSSSPWAQKANEHIESMVIARKVILEGFVIKDIKIGDVFPSIYKYYSTHPVGYVEICVFLFRLKSTWIIQPKAKALIFIQGREKKSNYLLSLIIRYLR